MNPAIRIRGLSKTYRIGATPSEYKTLRESLSDAASRAVRTTRAALTGRTAAPPPELLHRALDEVSFEVQPGEVLGIIGRNGAGKSTLLKILSRITEPTAGRAELRGRVGSLLEVGTGFHPELTGRENIFLNGAILGMTRREIVEKFDEIVAFAEIERFLDTPVKRYSSGMYVRLGFSVAAHLDLEILIVDEVLAVGDAAFQRKCLGKMSDVSRSGRTILFVSHSMSAVKSLCTRAVLLENGRLASEGAVDRVVDAYMVAGSDMPATGIIPEDAPRIGNGRARFRSVKLSDAGSRPVSEIYFGGSFRVTCTCELLADIDDAVYEVSVSALDGTHVLLTTTLDDAHVPLSLSKGVHVVDVEIDAILLPRDYTIDVGIHHRSGRTIDFVQRCLDFTVLRVAATGDGHYPWHHPVRGYLRPRARWRVDREVPLTSSSF